MSAPPKGETRPPCPIRYCPVEHGGLPFPEMILALAEHPEIDPFARMALIRRVLCRAAGAAAIPCDPAACAAGLTGSAAAPVGAFVNACKVVWRDYHDAEFNRTFVRQPAAWANLLDDFDWDQP